MRSFPRLKQSQLELYFSLGVSRNPHLHLHGGDRARTRTVVHLGGAAGKRIVFVEGYDLVVLRGHQRLPLRAVLRRQSQISCVTIKGRGHSA